MNNGKWYCNMQGGANGASFAAYDKAGDVNNNLYFWYKDAIPEDPYGLDNVSYGLMYWDDSLYGKAMMTSSESPNALDAKPLMVLATSDNKKQLFVPNDSDISMWTFHWDNDDKYYLSATVDGSTKYLKIDTNGLSLVDNESEASLVQVIPGTGAHAGQICLKSGGTTLTFSGSTSAGFSTGGSVGTEWLNLVELSELSSDYYKTYSASKVSVSDESIKTGSKVIVYTRAWDDQEKKYNYYAIDHDGTLVKCYENGDAIEWVGSVINTMLWQFTEYPDADDEDKLSYYYELFNEYSQKYLAPQVTDEQIISDSAIGINMNGRRYGQYYSSILAWDEANYSFAGLKVENGKIVSCPKAEAMDFYFATIDEIPYDDALKTVKTVDNTQHGITMKLIDYNSTVSKIDNTPTTEEQHAVMGTSVFTQTNEQPGLLSTNLIDGYPTASLTNKSLYELFDDTRDVNHLFIQSIYNASGYFEYDSAQNFASLNGAAGGKYTSDFTGDFTVYKQLGSYDGSNKNTLKHGQFLPYNNIKAGHFASQNGQNLYSTLGDLLPDTDPRKYENLYAVTDPNNADLYFGLELEASFTQTPNGLDDWGHDIIFEFTGDDDFWLYVDGELVIDLGGVHSALPGAVNFRTGQVKVNGKSTTLREIFENNYRTRNPDATDEDVTTYLNKYFDEGSTVFREYSTHTMKIFYMERGGGASNLHMRFNLASVKPGTVELSKELDGVDETESTMAEFAYQIKYKKKNDPTEYLLTNNVQGNGNAKDYVFYKGTDTSVTFESTKTIGGQQYENVFILKPKETVVINFPISGNSIDEIESYSIIECGVNTDVYKSVTVNGTTLNGDPVSGTDNRKDYGIDYQSTKERQRVNYVNEVDPEAKRTLTFRKRLYDADGTTEITNDSTTFGFRLYFGTESDTELNPANMYTYHVKNKEGYYCKWDAEHQKFVAIGNITDYSELTDEQKIAASFSTSLHGSIAKIPVGYTVEVLQVLAGTQYKVQERPSEIPDGYSFQKYVYKADVNDAEPTEIYSGGNAVATEGAPDSQNHDGTIYNVIATGKDPHVDICNLKGWGLRVNKIWTDADYMTERETTYFAVYTRKQNGNEQGQGHGLWEYVKGSLMALPYGKTTLYWYWLKLPVENVPFDDYVIREVDIKHGSPQVDDDGKVVNDNELEFQEIRDNSHDTLTLEGTQKGETVPSDYTYTVHYNQGTISSESNVRVDTVTNDRPGIILKKQDMSGEALAGATFTLEDSDGTLIGTFTSDSDGNITTAFLGKNKEYTLREISAPQTYHGIQEPMKIVVTSSEHGAHASTVTVSGPDEKYYSLTQASGTSPATLIIKNQPFVFRAIKEDGNTNAKLEGVHFELHKQVTVDGVTIFDEAVMTDYEDLVTDANGEILKINNTLPAGTYQLREKDPPLGYQALPHHVEFTISKTGEISLLPSMSSSDWVSITSSTDPSEDDETGSLVYTMTIKNYSNASVIVRKVDDAGNNLLGSKFQLCKYAATWEAVSDYSGIDLTTVNEKELTKLSAGRYRLEETHIPSGYIVLNKYVYFNLNPDGTVFLTDENGTGTNSNENASVTNKGTITIKNTPGPALPSTGGPGRTIFYIYGSMLIAFAGFILLRRRYRT